jgi:Arc/MetJ family transcription regulator
MPVLSSVYTQSSLKLVYDRFMSRTNIDLDDRLIRRARRLTGLKTKKSVVHRALETLVRTEARKGILRYYGTGIWEGDLKAMRRSRLG